MRERFWGEWVLSRLPLLQASKQNEWVLRKPYAAYLLGVRSGSAKIKFLCLKVKTNFETLVLGCIDAAFRSQIFVGIRISFEKGIEKSGKKMRKRD